MIDRKVFKDGVYADNVDLAKIGWTEHRNDNEILSYVRGYIWRNYKVRIKEPLDFIILNMIHDSLSENKHSVITKPDKGEKDE